MRRGHRSREGEAPSLGISFARQGFRRAIERGSEKNEGAMGSLEER
jgi:hypothetical protein